MTEPLDDLYVQLWKNEKRAKERQEIDFQIPDTDDIDQLIDALHALTKQARSIPYYKSSRGRKQLSEIRYALIDKIQKSLKSIDQVKADAIKRDLYNQLGILLP